MRRFIGAMLLAAALAGAVSAQRSTQVTMNGGTQNDYYPVLSDDGSWLAWVGEVNFAFEVFSTQTATPSPKQLTTGGAATIPYALAMSGDGRVLAFISGQQVWIIPTGGGTAQPISTLSGTKRANTGLTLSRDGRYIGYTTFDTANNRYDFEVLDINTGQQVNVSNATGGFVTGCVSGDGTKVAFVRRDAANVDQVWLANIDGSSATTLTAFTRGAIQYPRLDRDATICAFEGTGTGEEEIYTVRTDGTNLVNASMWPNGRDRRVWLSSDGQRIAWKSRRGNTNTSDNLYVAHFDGSGLRPATTGLGLTVGSPNDSLTINGDGTVLAYAHRYNVGGGNPQADHEVWLWRDGLTRSGTPKNGQSIALVLDDPARPSVPYAVRCAFARAPGIPLPGAGTVPLAPDALFFLSGSLPGVFQAMDGVLDGSGTATATVAIPAASGLVGVRFWAGAIALTAPIHIYDSLRIEIE